MSTMRTPLKRVLGLGSAKDGTDHFWRQRVTAVAALLLLPVALWVILSLIGADYAAVRRTIGNPVVAMLLLLFVVTNIVHMRIGMQVIIEDYVHAEGAKITLLVLNTFFCVLVGIACHGGELLLVLAEQVELLCELRELGRIEHGRLRAAEERLLHLRTDRRHENAIVVLEADVRAVVAAHEVVVQVDVLYHPIAAPNLDVSERSVRGRTASAVQRVQHGAHAADLVSCGARHIPDDEYLIGAELAE